MWPLCGDFRSGGDPGAVRLSRTAQFSSALRRRPDTAYRNCPPYGWQRQFALVRWGLLPSWVKDPKDFTLVINARGESVMDKPAFSAAMKRRRCLVPADGFYEWKAIGAGKQPYYVRAKSGTPLAFAGLWETWTGPNGEEMETAAIVTTRANRTLADIHERMPVVVPPDAFNRWLDCANVDDKTAASLIAPARDDLLEAHEVSTAGSTGRPTMIRN